MARRKLQKFDEYRYGPRSILRPGERFRVKGGPVYVTDDAEKLPMYERGIFVFHRYFEQGAAKWIQAYKTDGGGVAILWVVWVGRSMKSPVVPGLRRKPYRVTSRVKETRREHARKLAAGRPTPRRGCDSTL